MIGDKKIHPETILYENTNNRKEDNQQGSYLGYSIKHIDKSKIGDIKKIQTMNDCELLQNKPVSDESILEKLPLGSRDILTVENKPVSDESTLEKLKLGSWDILTVEKEFTQDEDLHLKTYLEVNNEDKTAFFNQFETFLEQHSEFWFSTECAEELTIPDNKYALYVIKSTPKTNLTLYKHHEKSHYIILNPDDVKWATVYLQPESMKIERCTFTEQFKNMSYEKYEAEKNTREIFSYRLEDLFKSNHITWQVPTKLVSITKGIFNIDFTSQHLILGLLDQLHEYERSIYKPYEQLILDRFRELVRLNPMRVLVNPKPKPKPKNILIAEITKNKKHKYILFDKDGDIVFLLNNRSLFTNHMAITKMRTNMENNAEQKLKELKDKLEKPETFCCKNINEHGVISTDNINPKELEDKIKQVEDKAQYALEHFENKQGLGIYKFEKNPEILDFNIYLFYDIEWNWIATFPIHTHIPSKPLLII